MILNVHESTGAFAENKEQARSMRAKIAESLKAGETVTLDFLGVEYATQSFVHALVAELIRDESLAALDHLEFKSCSEPVRSVVEIVVSYAQDDWSEEPAAL